MKLSKSVAELQREHVVLELECIDRMYLNAYVPQLTSEAGVAGFVRRHLGHRFGSTKQVAEMTEAFVESIMQFGLDHKIDLVRFKKGQRKDDVMQGQLRGFKKKHQEGVVFIGVAQEKARVPRTVRKIFGEGGTTVIVGPGLSHIAHPNMPPERSNLRNAGHRKASGPLPAVLLPYWFRP